MKEYINKANTLLEALPYIRRFYNKTFVIKYGGHAMTEDKLKKSFAEDIVLLKYIGINPIVVHGGGPQIGKTLKALGIESKFIDGHRVTDDKVLEVVEMVLIGKVNKEIVTLINSHGGEAIGISGKDANFIIAKKLRHKEDLGWVGEVETVNTRIIKTLSEGNFIPIIAPLGIGIDGKGYNINADLVASSIAGALKAEKLILLTDIEGVIIDNKLQTKLSSKDFEKYKAQGKISGGMLPKLQGAIDALKNGVKKVHIIDGRIEHAILLEIFTDKGIGTEIVL